jgi:hypothetical protein
MEKHSANSAHTTNNNNWQPKNGWNGLVPGLDQLKNAIAVFGPPENEFKFGNGICYEFAKGTVKITTLDEKPDLISKIRVLAEPVYSDPLPTNLTELVEKYGPLNRTKLDEFGNIIYERPGLRSSVQLLSSPQSVNWVEFYLP